MLKRVARFIPFFTLSIIIGCSTPPVAVDTPHSKPKEPAVSTWLSQARQSSSPITEQLMLMAVRQLRTEGKNAEASNILETIDSRGLPTHTLANYIIETAYQALFNQDYNLAVSILTTDRMNFINIINQLDTKQSLESSLLRAIAWEESGNHLAAARERIFLASMLPNETASIHESASVQASMGPPKPNSIEMTRFSESRQQNAQQIWFNLTALDAEELEYLQQTATFDETKGWFQLAWLFRANQDNLDTQINELNHWLAQYPNHPAASPLPESLAILSQLVQQRPTQIALLLPMTGPYLPAAKAIQNGFLAAHFTDSKHSKNSPNTIGIENEEKKTLTTIKVYDSSNTSTFINTYNKAIAEGAELVVGALQKENVKSLQNYQSDLPVPTIALNRGHTNAENPANLFQFGLSPIDEAQQVAIQATKYEHENTAVLYPESPWGERVFNAFNKSWTDLGGSAATTSTFDNKGDYSSSIKKMLMIEQSKSRANRLKGILGMPFEFKPRRRQDIDFVFILASPKQARQIKPLLDFHYASDIPVFATSHIYSGSAESSKDRDIDGIEFCDIPWILSPPTATQNNLDQAWPNNPPRYRRLNALGVDAYRLHARIQLLTAVPQARFFGATGVLSLSPENFITRELAWAKIQQGKPTSVQKHQAKSQNDHSQGTINGKQWNKGQRGDQPQKPENPGGSQSRKPSKAVFGTTGPSI